MFVKSLLSLAAWGNYFNVKNYITKEYADPLKNPLLIREKRVYVLNCFFEDSKAESFGGAMNCQDVEFLVVESTRFFNCKTDAAQGGAICFTYNLNGNGNYAIAKSCAIGCIAGVSTTTSSSYGQFCYISTISNGKKARNVIETASTIFCDNYERNSWYTMYIQNGDTTFNDANVSNNKADQVSAFHISYVGSLLLYFTQVSDNSAKSGDCIVFYICPNAYITSCNIIGNTAKRIINVNKEMQIEKSSFQRNKCDALFFAGGGLISIRECSTDITITNMPNVNSINPPASPFINKLTSVDCATTVISTPTKRIKCNPYQKCKQFGRFGINRAFL